MTYPHCFRSCFITESIYIIDQDCICTSEKVNAISGYTISQLSAFGLSLLCGYLSSFTYNLLLYTIMKNGIPLLSLVLCEVRF